MKLFVKYNKHRNRQNNFIVAGMFNMYQSGKSLAEVGKVYKKSRQSVYDVFRTRGYALRSKQFKGQQILDDISFTICKGGYLRGTLNTRRLLMHQYVWEKATGKKLPRGWVVIHKDTNRENNSIENLEAMTLSDWNKKFSPHLNQYTSPTGSRRKKGDRARAEYQERWQKAMKIGKE